jgi:drug/metabolite transporter (DMT)-like permease
MRIYVVLLFNILLLVTGQTVWKIGLDRSGGLRLDNLLSVLFSPLILLGILIYGIATLLWLYVLSRLPISLAYPLQSIAYVLALLIAFFFFKESVPLNRWIGAAIILGGITVLSLK